MQDYAVGAPLPGKAVILMFERISAQHKKRCACAFCKWSPFVHTLSLDVKFQSGVVLVRPDVFFSLVLCSGRPVSLICTGALTNAALLILLYPEVVPMINITIMGGCIGTGNTGPVVEFNIQVELQVTSLSLITNITLWMHGSFSQAANMQPEKECK